MDVLWSSLCSLSLYSREIKKLCLSVKDVVNNLVNKNVSIRAKSEGASKVTGKKRHKYTVAFKAD